MDLLVTATSLYNDPAAEDWQPDLRSTVAYLRRNNIDAGFIYEPVLSRDGIAARCSNLAPRILFLELSEETRAPALDFACRFKAARPETLVAVGGISPTLIWSDFLRDYDYIDFIVAGERDVTLLEAAERLRQGRGLDHVAGLQSRQFRNPPRPLLSDLDCLEGMAQDGLAHLLKRYPPRERVGYVVGSRGCYANCSFCGVPDFFRHSKGSSWRGRSPRSIVKELSALSEAFEISQFVFVDDNFIGPGRLGQERAQQIAQEIIAHNLSIEYHICCRLSDIQQTTFEILQEAGLRGVGVSVESTNQSSLNLLGKGMKSEIIYPTLSLLESMGLQCQVNLIFFDPNVTLEGVKSNLALLGYLRNSEYLSYSDAFPFNELTAFPWSRVASTLGKDNLLAHGSRCRFRDQRVARLVEFARSLRTHVSCCFKKRLLLDNHCSSDFVDLSAQEALCLSRVTAGLRSWIALDVLPRTLRAACDVLESTSDDIDQKLGDLEESFQREITFIRLKMVSCSPPNATACTTFA
jgi:radical SAM family protein